MLFLDVSGWIFGKIVWDLEQVEKEIPIFSTDYLF